jgi:hypothetical protein
LLNRAFAESKESQAFHAVGTLSCSSICDGDRMTRVRLKLALHSTIDAILQYWAFLIVAVASVAFIVASFFDDWPPKLTTTLLVALFNILVLCWLKFDRDVRKEISDLRSDLFKTNHVVEVINEREYFRNMTVAMSSAKDRVDLTYLDRTKPSASELKELNDYFETAKAVVQKPEIRIRRTVRIETTDTLEWVIELLEQFGSCRNYSMACLREPSDAAISLQIFDCREMLIVQPDKGVIGSGRQGQMLRIRGEAMATIFSDYYDRRWKAAILIKAGNRIHRENLIDIAQRLSAQARKPQRLSAQARKKNQTVTVQNIDVLLKRINKLPTEDRNKTG